MRVVCDVDFRGILGSVILHDLTPSIGGDCFLPHATCELTTVFRPATAQSFKFVQMHPCDDFFLFSDLSNSIMGAGQKFEEEV